MPENSRDLPVAVQPGAPRIDAVNDLLERLKHVMAAQQRLFASLDLNQLAQECTVNRVQMALEKTSTSASSPKSPNATGPRSGYEEAPAELR